MLVKRVKPKSRCKSGIGHFRGWPIKVLLSVPMAGLVRWVELGGSAILRCQCFFQSIVGLLLAGVLASCGAAVENGGDTSIKASRAFAGPSQFPPIDFKAYGILAFPSRATSSTRARHMYICEAYQAGLSHTSLLGVPQSEQMVTVWPISDNVLANELNSEPLEQSCGEAVDGYGLVAAQTALKQARTAGYALKEEGPYLLAWSPARDKGKPGVPVLMADLSNVTTPKGARDVFNKWADDIEQNPKLWDNGWSLESLRLTIRLWADRYGSNILDIKGGA